MGISKFRHSTSPMIKILKRSESTDLGLTQELIRNLKGGSDFASLRFDAVDGGGSTGSLLNSQI